MTMADDIVNVDCSCDDGDVQNVNMFKHSRVLEAQWTNPTCTKKSLNSNSPGGGEIWHDDLRLPPREHWSRTLINLPFLLGKESH